MTSETTTAGPNPAPSGEQYEIAGHGYRAVVTEIGACLRLLQYEGRDLVVSFDRDEAMVGFRGALAAPWPNRIADGRYPVDGVAVHVPVNEPSRDCALHGLVFDRAWRLLAQAPGEVVLGLRLPAGPGYPFQLDFTARYALAADGLTTTIEVCNSGAGTAPYGVCPHPYLRAGDSPLDSWTLMLPADRFLEVTPDRLLPVGVVDVAAGDGAFDFREPRVLGATEIDHAFTGIIQDSGGRATLELREADGRGVAMSFGPECPWLQVHTADLPLPGVTRLGLAVEPMTCPPDAFNSGIDLVRLAPGDTHEASWRISAL
ncbi:MULTISPECIES: aldose 1-epimerase family protein [unclassified Cryobacterium]|uniref:aldose 1-epimerase family protein n=1 Tax=unclassified Cryobacterium TaxID=2649013 RepID=UPI002AB59FD6|nr:MULTISPECIES: aldose 1-epimerase family protein [unclassified Cryobacterium]MDY7529196.1 aldose 1-epimerase family protein [Cryobacterium sp. 10C2]MDY7558644.1 aldose 1-epimerase family protein [Cryobacterium sp. 10C3]MEB0203277.1 aldose 1-epimerase family protein [Cryobacterium sp. 5I3]MEB0291886.1 aldose 1-epimerase family protein [Cryobacterium sp. 10C2]